MSDRSHSLAIVIGNKNYENGIPTVDYAHNDADAIRSFVQNGLKYDEILFYKDARQSDLINLFGTENSHKGQIYDYVMPNETDVFIYYSGHGSPSLDDGRGYILPSDGNPYRVELRS